MSRRGRLVVTGGSGFLGTAIMGSALHAGYQVCNIDRQFNRSQKYVETAVGDISDSPFLRKTFRGAFAVVHAAGLAHVFGSAAQKPDLFDRINEKGTDIVVDAALSAGVKKIVLVSSVSVYGHNSQGSCYETEPCSPRGPYAISKWRAEQRALERVGSGPASLSILRFATIYGEGDRGNVARLIQKLNRGRFIWPGTGSNSKSLIYKDDAARACIFALTDLQPGANIFNVSTHLATMQEIVTSICVALGRPVPALRIPESLVRSLLAACRKTNRTSQLAAMLQKFLHDDVYPASKFEQALGFNASISLSEGISREVADLCRSGRL